MVIRTESLRHSEADSFASEIASETGNFSCLELLLNPQCMTTMNWMRAQAEDKTIGKIIERYKTKELQKGKDTDRQDIKQFLKQRVSYS